MFKQELTNKGVNNIDKALQQGFQEWFKGHVRNLNNVSADLHTLSQGPDRCVAVYSACNLNGARFRTLDREKNLRTQNSGVMNKASSGAQGEIEFYGVLKEILELRYLPNKFGDRSGFLFHCDRFDQSGKRTGMKDDGYFKSVNTTAFWYKNAPFILAHQAQTCYYLDDTKLGHPWKVVMTFSHRHVYDVPEKNDGADVEVQGNDSAYQEEICSSDRIVQDVQDAYEDEDSQIDRPDEVEHIDARIVDDLERQDDNANELLDMSEDEIIDENDEPINSEDEHTDED